MGKFHFKSVIVRNVPDTMAENGLRIEDGESGVDVENAKKQHDFYVSTFRDLGLEVIRIEADNNLADCEFVEDPLIVIGKKALLNMPGHPNREQERIAMLNAVKKIPELELHLMEEIDPNARLDGGDVLYTGQEIFVGRSSRTNDAAIDVVSKVFSPLSVTPIDVDKDLHLKSVCGMGNSSTLVVGVGTESSKSVAESLKAKAKASYTFAEVKGHPFGANFIFLETDNGTVVIHQNFDVFPEIKEVVQTIEADKKIMVDVSEFAKVDGCLSCLSVLIPYE